MYIYIYIYVYENPPPPGGMKLVAASLIPQWKGGIFLGETNATQCTEWTVETKHTFGDNQIMLTKYVVFPTKNYAFWNASQMHGMDCEL